MLVRPFLHRGPSHIEIKKIDITSSKTMLDQHDMLRRITPPKAIAMCDSAKPVIQVFLVASLSAYTIINTSSHQGGLWYSRKKPRVMKRMAITDLNSIV
jgi:hypothetical protein